MFVRSSKSHSMEARCLAKILAPARLCLLSRGRLPLRDGLILRTAKIAPICLTLRHREIKEGTVRNIAAQLDNPQDLSRAPLRLCTRKVLDIIQSLTVSFPHDVRSPPMPAQAGAIENAIRSARPVRSIRSRGAGTSADHSRNDGAQFGVHGRTGMGICCDRRDGADRRTYRAAADHSRWMAGGLADRGSGGRDHRAGHDASKSCAAGREYAFDLRDAGCLSARYRRWRPAAC